jgi:4-hydroxythreonine-4-phosphate dehydrogenase
VVIGTSESTTRAQVAALRAARNVPEWELHAEMTAFGWKRPHLSRTVEAVAARLSEGHAVLSLVGLHEALAREDAEQAMAALGEVVRRVTVARRPGGLVVSGGWTAVTVLRALGAQGAEILGPVGAAMPLCRVVGGAMAGTALVTKGGALGSDEALDRAVGFYDRTDRDRRETSSRPLLGITMGDACGVGPEVIAKALAHADAYSWCRPLVIGDAELLRRAVRTVRGKLDVREVETPEAAAFTSGTVDVYSPIVVDHEKVVMGRVCPEAGRAAAEWVIEAVRLAKAGRIGAIVTAPLNKEAMNLAGYAYAGHTELLAEKAGSKGARLMLASDRMKVAHVTGHIALHDVPARLTRERVRETIEMLGEALRRMGSPDPKIAVCGLNPHAGENGLFGQEDEAVIRPAVEEALARGWKAEGPLPADTTFFKVYDGLYDGVVAMYHDQGHVPAKLVAFADAVNVTLGLPIVRTSVDHGTAFDIAGKGVAREGNMLCAMRLAARLAPPEAPRS